MDIRIYKTIIRNFGYLKFLYHIFALGIQKTRHGLGRKHYHTRLQSNRKKYKKYLVFIGDVNSNADEVQVFFSDTVTQNADVEYLRHHGFHGQTDRETFSSYHYKDL